MKTIRDFFTSITSVLTIFALAVMGVPRIAQADLEDDIMALMVTVNAELVEVDSELRLEVVEYYTAKDEQGQTVFFNNVGNKQLIYGFVPGDPRRAFWSGPVGVAGDDITYASDGSLLEGDATPPGGLVATQAAISSAMATWQGAKCSNLPLNVVFTGGVDIGYLQFLVNSSGSPVPVADIVHGGFGTIVDALLPPPIIAAAFTFTFVGPPDIDNDGRIDTALVEIYYTNNFPWDTTGGSPGIDVETVALHETGHGLSQAHFGKLFRTDHNGKFHFAPMAVMNSGYTGPQRKLTGTDVGGHCSNWAQWPNN